AWSEAPGWTEKDRQRRRYLGCQARPRSDCVVKLRLDPRCVPVHKPQRNGGVLETRRELTHDISEFGFRLERPQVFEPGQYALAMLPGVTGARAYSMSNVSLDGRQWEFQVRRVPGGSGSAALFDSLRAGDPVELDGPYGMAWLRRDAPRDILCIAGGSGLAPMISIARAAMVERRLAGRRLDFVYGARTPADVCGEDMLRELPGWGERLGYLAAVSLPPDDGAAWSGPIGFVHEIARERFGARLAELEIYFAGPPQMANAVQQVLFEAKVPSEQVHFDQFY
ncbi:MAG: FAD-binding oxidoreductase, partial [Pseudomonadota bacterium]|nr:FAD-binding oxidoreductase [Pseudomonadota bacterium]